MIRLFAAILMPDEISAALAQRQAGIPGADWRPRESLHLTLRFAGDVAESQAVDFAAELSGVGGAPFSIRLKGAGVFNDGGQARSLWAGVEAGEALRLLARRCDTAARRSGLPPERRPWRPHVTLAYLRRAEPPDVAHWLQGHNLLASPPFAVIGFGLYSSWRTRRGSTYRLEQYYDLA